MVEANWKDHARVSGESFHIAIERGGGGWSFPEHGHKDLCETTIVLRGELSQRLNGRRFVDRRGQLTLIRPGDVHELAGKDFEFVNLAFPPRWLKAAETLWEAPGLCQPLLDAKEPPRALAPEEPFGELERRLRGLLYAKKGLAARQAFAESLLEILSRRFAPQLRQEEGEARARTPWLVETLAWLDSKASEIGELEVEDIVKKACKCPEHVARTFQRELGTSPTELLVKLKLAKAAALLAGSNYSVSEIGSLSGYGNFSYFSRLFKAAYGLAPREYRRKSSAAWALRSKAEREKEPSRV